MMIKLNPTQSSELAGIVASGAFFRASDYRSSRDSSSRLKGMFFVIWAMIALSIAVLSRPWESEVAYTYQISYLLVLPFFLALFLYTPAVLLKKLFRLTLRG
jgi:hypothetical protein